jgi:hypothetical protein
MTQKQEYLRRGLLAKIHMHPHVKQRKEFDVWEEYLLNAYGVKSCAELSIDELYNLLDVLNGNGKVQERISGVRPRTKKKKTDGTERLTEKQEAYLKKLWDLEADKRGLVVATKELADFSLRTLGFRFLYINHLSVEQANKLITGSEYLKGIKQKKRGKK